jgi:hypothetical protein
MVNCSRAFIIIDALDEFSGADRILSRFMEELSSLQVKTGANVFANHDQYWAFQKTLKAEGAASLRSAPGTKICGDT